jgi:hypothetical protein
MYNSYPPNVRAQLKSASIKNVMNQIFDDFEWDYGRELKSVSQGVYVISLSYPFTIKYENASSDIV